MSRQTDAAGPHAVAHCGQWWRISLAMLIGLALTVAACGSPTGGSGGPTPTPKPTPKPTLTPTATILSSPVPTPVPHNFKCAASDVPETAWNTGWAQFGYEPADTRCQPFEKLLSPSTVSGLQLDWQVAGVTFGAAVPAVVNGVVYAPSDYPDNKLYAFRAATGAQVWSTPIPTVIGADPSPPAVSNGAVYISINDALYTFSAATGTPGWSFTTGGLLLKAAPAISDDVVYIASQDRHLYALRAKSGTVLWSAATGGSFVPAGPVAIASGAVYVTANNALEAFSAKTGVLLWSVPDIADSAPVYANGLVYVGGAGYSVYAFVAKTGAQVWKAATGNVVNPSVAVDRTTVYAGSADGLLYAFSATTGAKRWSAVTNPGDGIFAAAAVANGVVYVASACDCGVDSENHLFAYSAATGARLWSYAPGYPVYAAPVVVNGRLYWGTRPALETFHL
jgi:outer membrane protein assembly factor BamB